MNLFQLIGGYGHGKFGCIRRHRSDLVFLQFNGINFIIGCVKVIHDLDGVNIFEPGQLVFSDAVYIGSIVLVNWCFNDFLTQRNSSNSIISCLCVRSVNLLYCSVVWGGMFV